MSGKIILFAALFVKAANVQLLVSLNCLQFYELEDKNKIDTSRK